MEKKQYGLRSTARRRRRGRPVPSASVVSLALLCVAAGLGVVPTSAHSGEESGSEGTTITGVIRDHEGKPISAAFVQLEKRRVSSVPNSWHDADGEGRFELKNVPKGAVRLRAVAGASTVFSTAGKVIDTRGGVRDLRISLKTGREVRLKVEDYGRYDHRGLGPTPGAWLVLDRDGTGGADFRWAPITKDGSIRFVQLPDRPSFEVWGHAAVDRPFKQGGLKASKTVRVIRTVKGLTISGRILPAKVAVKDNPSMSARPYPGFRFGYKRIKSDGTFVIRGLPRGKYEVWCVLGSMEHMSLLEIKTARAGDTGVELDFRELVR